MARIVWDKKQGSVKLVRDAREQPLRHEACPACGQSAGVFALVHEGRVAGNAIMCEACGTASEAGSPAGSLAEESKPQPARRAVARDALLDADEN